MIVTFKQAFCLCQRNLALLTIPVYYGRARINFIAKAAFQFRCVCALSINPSHSQEKTMADKGLASNKAGQSASKLQTEILTYEGEKCVHCVLDLCTSPPKKVFVMCTGEGYSAVEGGCVEHSGGGDVEEGKMFAESNILKMDADCRRNAANENRDGCVGDVSSFECGSTTVTPLNNSNDDPHSICHTKLADPIELCAGEALHKCERCVNCKSEVSEQKDIGSTQKHASEMNDDSNNKNDFLSDNHVVHVLTDANNSEIPTANKPTPLVHRAPVHENECCNVTLNTETVGSCKDVIATPTTHPTTANIVHNAPIHEHCCDTVHKLTEIVSSSDDLLINLHNSNVATDVIDQMTMDTTNVSVLQTSKEDVDTLLTDIATSNCQDGGQIASNCSEPLTEVFSCFDNDLFIQDREAEVIKGKASEPQEPSASETEVLFAQLPFSDAVSLQDLPVVLKVSPKKKKTKKPKKEKTNEKGDGDGRGNSTRPNYFVAIQVSNPQIVLNIESVQNSLVTAKPDFKAALINLKKLHITVKVIVVNSDEDIQRACKAMECCQESLRQILSIPLKITFETLGNFQNKVLFATVIDKIQLEQLKLISDTVQLCFAASGFPKDDDFKPHLTIAKLSKAPKLRYKKIKQIAESSYSNHKDQFFGVEVVNSLQLLAMMKPVDDKGYYRCVKEVSLGNNTTEEVVDKMNPTVGSTEKEAKNVKVGQDGDLVKDTKPEPLLHNDGQRGDEKTAVLESGIQDMDISPESETSSEVIGDTVKSTDEITSQDAKVQDDKMLKGTSLEQ